MAVSGGEVFQHLAIASPLFHCKIKSNLNGSPSLSIHLKNIRHTASTLDFILSFTAQLGQAGITHVSDIIHDQTIGYNLMLWTFVTHAGFVVKFVVLLLLSASIASWTIMIHKTMLFKQTQGEILRFHRLFSSTENLSHLYQQLPKVPGKLVGLAAMFQSGFTEFLALYKKAPHDSAASRIERAIHITQTRQTEHLEHHLNILATVASTSPYIGLFGTVWGIISAFHALAGQSSATLSLVAPGIAEALMATAVGLFTAIPAVIGYNRLTDKSERLMQQHHTFLAELCHILQRHTLSVDPVD